MPLDSLAAKPDNGRMNDIFDLKNLTDLPADIRGQLGATKRDELETELIGLLRVAGRDLTLDEVMVGYYRQYKKPCERRALMLKLYNMSRAKSPAIEAVEKRKGVYRLRADYVD